MQQTSTSTFDGSLFSVRRSSVDLSEHWVLRMKTTCCLLCVLSFAAAFASHASAAPKKPKKDTWYQGLGAPGDPKVSAHWNRYHDYSQSTKLLKRIAKAHPKIAKLKSLGKSHGGRDMWVMTLSGAGDPDKKSAMWIDGGIHANEIQSVEVVLYTAWYLTEMYSRHDEIRRLLDERTFYLMPMMSPDSRDDHFHKPNMTHTPRSGQRPIDDDRDGREGEDPADDLNRDGHITQMRVRDPNGRYKPHEEFPQYMVRAKPGEKGEFTLLGTEGIDNDGDGRVNEDGAGGYYDPNRGWGWNWQPESIQRGAHRYPFSIAENRMVADFVMTRPNIAGAQSYHNTGGMILRGPGGKNDRYDSGDVAVYTALAKKGEEMLPGYRYMEVATDLYEAFGGELDWMHQSRGVFCFTNELFTPFNYFRAKDEDGGFFGRTETRLKFDKYLLMSQGFVPWKKVKHPQFGEIEVGGMKKSFGRQPPSFLLEEECHRNMAFTLYHADQMPKVRVDWVKTRKLDGGLTEVTAAIVNERIIPTHSAADVKRKITRPDLVSVSGRDVKVVAGMTSSDRYFRRAKEQRRGPRALRIPTISGHGLVYVRWLVTGGGPFTVGIDSVKGGSDQKSSELK